MRAQLFEQKNDINTDPMAPFCKRFRFTPKGDYKDILKAFQSKHFTLQEKSLQFDNEFLLHFLQRMKFPSILYDESL